ncbi:hypothetical protein [Terrabacter sp. NPDC080008]|uniref:hypothetical protein n=1 Tax=Terrabacter sp. NPDC080008 TaxID=3155176 RepID=UPI00344B3482
MKVTLTAVTPVRGTPATPPTGTRRHVPAGIGAAYGPTRLDLRVSRARPVTATKPDPVGALVAVASEGVPALASGPADAGGGSATPSTSDDETTARAATSNTP